MRGQISLISFRSYFYFAIEQIILLKHAYRRVTMILSQLGKHYSCLPWKENAQIRKHWDNFPSGDLQNIGFLQFVHFGKSKLYVPFEYIVGTGPSCLWSPCSCFASLVVIDVIAMFSCLRFNTIYQINV